MEHQPIISVVMSVYNGSRFLRDSIDSILSQTFIDFEFIIWNDGSTDDSEEIIKCYEDSRIRYFYHDNLGLGRALNLACQEARGKYIARMDDDDISLPDRLQKEYDYLESHPDVVLVSSSAYYIDEKGNSLGQSFQYTHPRVIKSRIFHPCAMFRKIEYNKTQGYPAAKNSQDTLLWSKLSKYGKLANIEEPLIKYRLISSSISHSSDPQSPYYKMQLTLRDKMCADENIADEDIELYNILAGLTPKISCDFVYKRTFEEKLHSIFSKIIGTNNSRHIIISLKNIYGLIRNKINENFYESVDV